VRLLANYALSVPLRVILDVEQNLETLGREPGRVAASGHARDAVEKLWANRLRAFRKVRRGVGASWVIG